MNARHLCAAVLTAAAFACAPAGGADLEAGRRKAEVCVACHGPAGVSTNAAWPSLAGQPAQFISTQLFFFREGNRKNELMSPMAAKLTNAEMNDLAAYFSAQKPAPARPLEAEKAQAGQRLTQQYRCVSCHGATLSGVQHIPRLAGQQADYLRAQLKGFVAQTRFDMDGNMTSAVRGMSAADIDTLAEYLASLGTP